METNSEPSTQPFRLLDLPRELRNAIYEHATVESVEIDRGFDPEDSKIHARNMPILNLLLANRQVSREYAEQTAGRITLVIFGAYCDFWTGYHDIPPELGQVVRDLTVYIHVVCLCDFMDQQERDDFEGPCDGAEFVYNYAQDLRIFLNKLPNLQSLHLKVGIWGARDAVYEESQPRAEAPQLSHMPEFKTNLDILVSLPRVQDVELVKCASQSEYRRYCEAPTNPGFPCFATWNPKDGWNATLHAK